MSTLKAIRVFYRKSDGKPVWYHSLMGDGEFSTTIEDDLSQIQFKKPDNETAIGGVYEDYDCYIETNPSKLKKFWNKPWKL